MKRRLIDANALKCELDLSPDEWAKGRTIYGIINEQPIIDAEPVRHGYWINKGQYYDIDGDLYQEYSCSACGRFIQAYNGLDEYPYCHCGAKMIDEV